MRIQVQEHALTTTLVQRPIKPATECKAGHLCYRGKTMPTSGTIPGLKCFQLWFCFPKSGSVTYRRLVLLVNEHNVQLCINFAVYQKCDHSNLIVLHQSTWKQLYTLFARGFSSGGLATSIDRFLSTIPFILPSFPWLTEILAQT